MTCTECGTKMEFLEESKSGHWYQCPKCHYVSHKNNAPAKKDKKDK